MTSKYGISNIGLAEWVKYNENSVDCCTVSFLRFDAN